MSVQLAVNRLLGNRMIFRIVSLVIVCLLVFSTYMSGTWAFHTGVSAFNVFTGGAPNQTPTESGLKIIKGLFAVDENANLVEVRDDSVQFPFLVYIPSITEPIEYVVYERLEDEEADDVRIRTGTFIPTGDEDDPNSIIFLNGWQYARIRDVPVGTWYRVSEIPIAGYFTDSMGSSGNVFPGGTIVDFANGFCVPGNCGVLELTKTTSNNSSSEFRFNVRFEMDGELFAHPIMYSIDDGEIEVFENPSDVTLSHGRVARFYNLPHGLRYIVEEHDYRDQNYYPAVDRFTGYISSGAPLIRLEAQNYVLTGDETEGIIEITKNVSGDDADHNRSFGFILSFDDIDGFLDSLRTPGDELDSELSEGDSNVDDEDERLDEDSDEDIDPTDEPDERTDPVEPNEPESDPWRNEAESDPDPRSNEPELQEEVDVDAEELDQEPADDHNVGHETVENEDSASESSTEVSQHSESESEAISSSGSQVFENESTGMFQSSIQEDLYEISMPTSIDDHVSAPGTDYDLSNANQSVDDELDIPSINLDSISENGIDFSFTGNGHYTIVDDEFHITLYVGETVTISNIPIGLRYTITEVLDDEYVPTIESVSGIIVAASPIPITFVNHKPDNVSLYVEKRTVDAPEELSDKVFRIWLYIDRERQYPPIDLVDGQRSERLEIPVGAFFELVEEDYFEYGFFAYAERAAGVQLVASTLEAVFTNFYKATPTPTPTPGGNLTGTPAPTPDNNLTGTPAPTPDNNLTGTPAPTPDNNLTGTPAPTPGNNLTGTPAPTPDNNLTGTPAPTPDNNLTGTPAPTPDNNLTGTPAPTPDNNLTGTPAPTPDDMRTPDEQTVTPTQGPNRTTTPTRPHQTATLTPSPSWTHTPTPGSNRVITPTPGDQSTPGTNNQTATPIPPGGGGQATPSPGGNNPQQPGGNDPQQPGGNNPQQPGGNDPQQPGGNNPQQPGGSDPQQPGGDNPQQPGGSDPQQPGGNNPQQPGGNDPQQPGGNNPQQPGGNDPQQPGGNNPQQPGGSNPQQPGGNSPQQPGGSNPQHQGGNNPQQPGGSNPQHQGGYNPQPGGSNLTPSDDGLVTSPLEDDWSQTIDAGEGADTSPSFDSIQITPPGDMFGDLAAADTQGDGAGIDIGTQGAQSFPPTIETDADRPQTGDDNNPIIWVSTMIVSALVLRFLLSNKSRLLGR